MQADGKLIRRMREERGFSLRPFAEKSGTHFTNLSRIENGTRHPRPQTLKRIADALGVPITDIATHEPPAEAR
jgi:transcriptional regulator with XRE-family HTH domain